MCVINTGTGTEPWQPCERETNKGGSLSLSVQSARKVSSYLQSHAHGRVLRDPRKRYTTCGPKVWTLELRSQCP